MPHSGGANQIRILSQRGQGKFRFFKRHVLAAFTNHLADARQKEISAFHDASAENNGLWCEEHDHIRKTKPEIVSLSFYRTLRQ